MRWLAILLLITAVLPPVALFGVARAEDLSVWPNSRSRANSDEWLAEHHDELRVMRPRVLVLDFSNELSVEDCTKKATALIEALRESSRWHGYRDEKAPAFLQYSLAKVVDLRDPPATVTSDGNSTLYPRAGDTRGGFGNFDYAPLYGERFARLYGFEEAGKPLALGELVSRGLVQEVWIVAKHTNLGAAWETVEVKQLWDESFKKKPGAFTKMAGNSGEHSAPWIGRSLRILFVNHERGTGCAMESLGHSLEHMATCGALPCYQRYFVRYAMLDLDRRLGLPFDSLYAKGNDPVRYPSSDTLVYTRDGREKKVAPYVVEGGNVHFCPNGRTDYDMANDAPVLSTIEHWRLRDGWDGADKAEPWTMKKVPSRAFEVAPDCMGPWVVYWRQNMPGLDNRARDDEGRPMKNWWPYLFY